MIIRDATEADVPEIQSIYAHHVLHGTGTFEEEPPSVEEMLSGSQGRRARLALAGGGRCDRACSATAITRSSATARRIAICVEDSVYVRENVRGQGVGKALVRAAGRGSATAARHAADDRGDRRFGECRLDRRACQPGVSHGRHDAGVGDEVRALAGRGVRCSVRWAAATRTCRRDGAWHGLSRAAGEIAGPIATRDAMPAGDAAPCGRAPVSLEADASGASSRTRRASAVADGGVRLRRRVCRCRCRASPCGCGCRKAARRWRSSG